MSYYDYRVSLDVSMRDYPFYSLIMAAMRGADSGNLAKLATAFPDAWEEFQRRYHAPGGLLDGETVTAE